MLQNQRQTATRSNKQDNAHYEAVTDKDIRAMKNTNLLDLHRQHGQELNDLRENIIEIQERITQPHRSILERGSSSHNESDHIGGMLATIEQIKEKYFDVLSQYLKERKTIEKIMDHVHDERERVILRYRYYNGGRDWADIYAIINLSAAQTRRIYNAAMKHFEEAQRE